MTWSGSVNPLKILNTQGDSWSNEVHVLPPYLKDEKSRLEGIPKRKMNHGVEGEEF